MIMHNIGANKSFIMTYTDNKLLICPFLIVTNNKKQKSETLTETLLHSDFISNTCGLKNKM